MFDTMVTVFGRHIENKMQERDEEGHLINDLRRLLEIPPDPAELREMTLTSLRLLEIEARKPRSGIVIDE